MVISSLDDVIDRCKGLAVLSNIFNLRMVPDPVRTNVVPIEGGGRLGKMISDFEGGKTLTNNAPSKTLRWPRLPGSGNAA